MRIFQLFLALMSFPALAEKVGEVATPIQVPVYQMGIGTSVPAAPEQSMLEVLKALQTQQQRDAAEAKRYRGLDPEKVERHYQRQGSTKGFEPAADSGPFAQTAKECGEKAQRECSPSNFGGRTMCGRAVAQMIKCMAPSIGGDRSCGGSCGHGKDFVKCSNGQMQRCGYTSISPTDPRCRQAGAVLSYTRSPTARGSVYGHVEFVCGDNKYCSVYRQPHDRPWPRAPADACWFPSQNGNQRQGGSQ